MLRTKAYVQSYVVLFAILDVMPNTEPTLN